MASASRAETLVATEVVEEQGGEAYQDQRGDGYHTLGGVHLLEDVVGLIQAPLEGHVHGLEDDCGVGGGGHDPRIFR